MCFHLYVKYSRINCMGLQQSHSASTKASTCHPAAKHPVHLHGCSHQLIQLPAAHLIQVSDKGTWSDLPHSVLSCGSKSNTWRSCSLPEGIVALDHELAKLFVRSPLQGFSSSNSPLYLLNHMTGSAVCYIVQLVPGF